MALARKAPTLAELDALPPHIKGEIIEGVMYTMTRPRGRHQRTALMISSRLSERFDLGHGGPGGWWILPEPGIELANTPEIAPDIAGWRRERLPVIPEEEAIQVAPDWVCEILSPTTRRHDLLVKKPYYARVGVMQACPEGQVCDDSSNECCVPSCGSAVCGTVPDGCGYMIDCGTCPSGQTCVDGACCASTCPVPEVGSPCGTIPNGCGGTMSCPGCGIGRVCAGGVCACKPGYKDCGDRCVPQNKECP